ncbi:MAG: hypothetical protein CMK32_05520 [Porticoccaceae bacterium]|nr:hypothetical protein [Porticoccaceae bacterium]
MTAIHFGRAILVLLVLITGCTSPGYGQPQNYDDYRDQGELYSEAELDQMLAPIALYPDALLSQVLMAATYPLEVVEAARWSADNPGLDGARAVDAVNDMPWDPSVKALVATPPLLARMNEDLDWTRAVGDAYLIQEEDVFDAIQRLRSHAYNAGNLQRLDHARVYRNQGMIYIEPYDPAVVYVPYYHPLSVYGNWWWPDFPPYYWGHPPGFSTGITFYWGHGFHVSPVFFFSTVHWHNRHILLVDRYRFRSYYDRHRYFYTYSGGHRWRHNPVHRHGVAYPNRARTYFDRHHKSYRDRVRYIDKPHRLNLRRWQTRRDADWRQGGFKSGGDYDRRHYQPNDQRQHKTAPRNDRHDAAGRSRRPGGGFDGNGSSRDRTRGEWLARDGDTRFSGHPGRGGEAGSGAADRKGAWNDQRGQRSQWQQRGPEVRREQYGGERTPQQARRKSDTPSERLSVGPSGREAGMRRPPMPDRRLERSARKSVEPTGRDYRAQRDSSDRGFSSGGRESRSAGGKEHRANPRTFNSRREGGRAFGGSDRQAGGRYQR